MAKQLQIDPEVQFTLLKRFFKLGQPMTRTEVAFFIVSQAHPRKADETLEVYSLRIAPAVATMKTTLGKIKTALEEGSCRALGGPPANKIYFAAFEKLIPDARGRKKKEVSETFVGESENDAEKLAEMLGLDHD